jgi:hypothetical protein
MALFTRLGLFFFFFASLLSLSSWTDPWASHVPGPLPCSTPSGTARLHRAREGVHDRAPPPCCAKPYQTPSPFIVTPHTAGPHFPFPFFSSWSAEKPLERLLSPLLLHTILSKLKRTGVALPILVCLVSVLDHRSTAPPTHQHWGRHRHHYPHSSEPPLNSLWHQSSDWDSPHSTYFSWRTLLWSSEPTERLCRWKTSLHRRFSTASSQLKCFGEVSLSSLCPVGHPITTRAETTSVGAPSRPSRRRAATRAPRAVTTAGECSCLDDGVGRPRPT